MTAPAPVLAPGVTTTVTVTAGHIAAGIAGDCGACPVALAIHDALGARPYITVMVFAAEAVARQCDRYVEASLPQAARDFIGRFDSTQPVEPFTFDLTWQEEDS